MWCVGAASTCATRWPRGSRSSVHEGTIGRWLRRLGLTRLQPRPYHPKKDAAAQEAFKKTSPPSCRGLAGHRGWQAGRDLVPGRSQGRTEGLAQPSLGTGRLAPADGARQPPRLRLPVRRHLPGPRRRCCDRSCRPPTPMHEPAPGRDQRPGRSRRACRAGLRWRRLASAGGKLHGARQHHAAPSAALRARVEPDGERLGISCAATNSPPWSGTLRGHRRRLRQRLALPHRDPERIRSIGTRDWACVSL